MIAHTGVYVTHYEKSKKFYLAVLKTVGYKLSMEFGEAAGFMEGGETSFWIGAKKKVMPGHVAFLAKDKRAVDNFYRVALRHGATDHGKPGYRPDYWPGYYAAFILDADGNNIEAVWFDYSKVKSQRSVKAKASSPKKKRAKQK